MFYVYGFRGTDEFFGALVPDEKTVRDVKTYRRCVGWQVFSRMLP